MKRLMTLFGAVLYCTNAYAVPKADAELLKGRAQVQCVAKAMYYEARGEDVSSQLGVGNLVLNRALNLRQPLKPCAVIAKNAQFSWYSSKAMQVKAPEKFVMLAGFLLQSARQGVRFDNTNGSTYFHSTDVHPYWARQFRRTVRFQHLTFYKEV